MCKGWISLGYLRMLGGNWLTVSHAWKWCEHMGGLRVNVAALPAHSTRENGTTLLQWDFPCQDKAELGLMGLLPLQTHCKFSTSLICLSLQCTSAQKHNCHMPATFSALVLGQQLFRGFQHCRSLAEAWEREKGPAWISPFCAACGPYSSTHPVGRNNDWQSKIACEPDSWAPFNPFWLVTGLQKCFKYFIWCFQKKASLSVCSKPFSSKGFNNNRAKEECF